jgi:PAS domain S-box-containing protein
LVVALFVLGTWRQRHTAYLNRVLAAEVQRNTIADRLALITQHVNDAIFLFDEEGRILEANEYAQTLYGRTLGEMRRLRAADLRGPESVASTPANFAQALTPAGIRFETDHRRADGTLFPVEANAKLVLIDGRRHVLSIVRDITERRIQEQEIERLNRIYLVLSLLNQAIVRTRDRQELLDRVCTILVEAGGFKIAWLGWLDPQTDLLRPVAVAGDVHGYVSNLRISRDASSPNGQGPSGTAFREGRLYVCNDFHRDPVTQPWREAAARSGIAASITLPVHFEGQPAGLLTAYTGTIDYFGHREIPLMEQIASDVSFALEVLAGEERRRSAEAALRASENRLKFLVTSTPAVIYSLRAHGDYATTFISPNVAELLGYQPDEFLADPGFWLAHLHPDDVPRATAEFARLIGAGKIVREYRFRHRDGSYRWMHDEVRVVLDALGAPQDFVGYWFDITARKLAEENLRKLSRIVEQAPLSIAITDLAGAIAYVNPKFLTVSGYTNEEILGQNPRVLQSGRTPTEVYTEMWATLTRGQVWQGELCNRRKNGELYFENAVIAPVVDETGAPTHYVALKDDITEIKRTADALREVQNRYRLIAENTADVIWLYDLAASRFTYCSPSVRNLLGHDSETVLGQSMAQILSAESAAYVAAALPKRLAAYARGDTSALTWTDELGQRHLDGSVVPTEVVTTLLPDGTGRVTQVIGVTRDITERVKARAALQRFNAELETKVTDRTAELAQRNREIQALLQSIPDTVLHLRTDGTVLYKQAAPGAPESRMLGDSVSPFQASSALLSPSLEIGRRAIAAGGTVTTEAEITLAGGPLTLELRATPSGPDAVVVFARDITARKRLEIETAAMLEKERQVSEMKTRFISVTSHEFRTPMAAALGSVELLRNHLDRLAPAKREELFGRITTSMHRMTEMLDDVLTLNRMDANRIEMRLAPSDLRHFLHNAIDEIRLADRDAHELVLRLTPDAPIPFVTDVNLLHHIVSNLLSNAVRYSPPGKPITVTVTAGDERLQLTVEDEGIGIPAADHARIFQPFERASNVGQIKGTGLGLSIVKRMSEMLGGTIALATAPTGGCCFTLTLPHLPPPSTAP